MLSIERQEQIVERLNSNGIVKVSELSKIFSVTEKTIRLDLDLLEKKGYLKKIHGGAVLVKGQEQILPIKERQLQHSAEKVAIAKAALETIVPGETILMDGGSTTASLAKLLGDFPVTVITNDIQIASILLNKEKVDLLVLGGSKIGTSSSLIGAQASELIKKLHVRRLFLGTTGFDLDYGLTVFNSLHAEWKKQIIRCAEHVTLLIDASKIGQVALLQFGSLDEIDEIITDKRIDPVKRQKLIDSDVLLKIV